MNLLIFFTQSCVLTLLKQLSLCFMHLQFKSFENTVGKGEIAHNEQFLLSPFCFLNFWRTLYHFHQILNCILQTLSFWKSFKFCCLLTLSQTNHFFYIFSVQIFRKHCGKRRNCFNEQFLLWGSVLYPFGELATISIEVEIVFCILFHFGRV